MNYAPSQLADPQTTIAALQEELTETNRGLLLLTLELEDRVAARTNELREAHAELERTNAELMQLTLDLENRVTQRTAELQLEVAQRAQAEAALRESEHRYRSLVEASPEAILVNRGGRIAFANAAALRLFGAERAEQVLGRTPYDLFHADFHEQIREQIAGMLASGCQANLMDERIVRLDGAVRDVDVFAVPFEEHGERLIQVILRDVTERKKADTRIQQQLSRLSLLHQITHAVGEHQDLSSIYHVVLAQLEENLSTQLCAICTVRPALDSLEVASVGPRCRPLHEQLELCEGARISVADAGLDDCVRGQTMYAGSLDEVAAPLAGKWAAAGLCSLLAAPLRAAGKTVGVLVIACRQRNGYSSADSEFLKQLADHVCLAAQHAQVLADLQKAYVDLRDSQKALLQQERLRALGQMASGIAHDINNSISPIAIYTESLLEKEPALSERARKYLTTISQAIEDVAHTVARMREFYRQQDKQIDLKPVNLNALVPQVVDLTRARWRDQPQQRGVTVELRIVCSPDLPNVMGVENEIRDALTNLILNAVDAMPQGGTLTVRTRVGIRKESESPFWTGPPTHAIVEVEDTGTGMDEETRQRCLEPFYTTKGERGTGLGLAMVYGAMQRHSGDIEISSAPGRGSTIRLLFLLPQDVLRARTSDSGIPVTIPPQRILVIDDDPLLRKSLRDAFLDDGHQVTLAAGGREGIEAFKAAQVRGEPFSVVFTDLGMPHMDGRSVALAIKQLSPKTGVILLTGWGRRIKSEGDIPAHVDQVLAKPPKIRELRQALASVLGGSTT